MAQDPGGGLAVSTGLGRAVVAAAVLGSGMAAIDATVVSIALPAIGRQFHTGFAALQWVVTGYALTLSALMLLGGALGDRVGRRRVFRTGVVWFGLASAGCALANGALVLVLVRILQGAGAALLTPGSLAILEASFAPGERQRAIGLWTGLGGVATAAGPLLGGYLVSAASWRWIFLINLPIAAVVTYLASKYVPESRDPNATGRLDLGGAALAVVALAGLSFAFIEGSGRGWGSPSVLASLVVGLLSAVALAVVEHRVSAPMLPPEVLRVRTFTVTNLVTLLVYAALGGLLFLAPIELQVVDHYSALESGLALLPITVMMLLLSSRSARLATAIGPRWQMSVGPLVVAAGVVLLARTTTSSSYLSAVLPAMVVFGLGLAITVAPLTVVALGALPSEHAGLASAFNNDVARIGGLLAVAVLPAMAGLSGSSYPHASALAGGFRVATWIAALWCVLGGLVAAVGLPRSQPSRGLHWPHLGTHPVPAQVHCALEAPALGTSGHVISVQSGVAALHRAWHGWTLRRRAARPRR